MLRNIVICAAVLALAGCSSLGKVENVPRHDVDGEPSYSIRAFQEKYRSDPNVLMLAFSGGGTRAAALSYGVLKELRDTRIPGSKSDRRLLDEIHSISSVSGGSFTAAYFGLHGEKIFDDYEQVFLKQNVQGALIRGLLDPIHWFSTAGRTEMAVKYYEDTVFKGATFADMQRRDGPLIIINASDLAAGVRFSFIQEYFDLLCSDLSSFPVARAVAASSAVPVVFNPVVVENYPDCSQEKQIWLSNLQERVGDEADLVLTAEGLRTLSDHENRRYIHLVDGGIADNLGLRAFYEMVELSGGIVRYSENYRREPPRRLVLISVNAATDPKLTMDQTREQPSIAASISALSDVQLRRYSADTIVLMKKTLKRWAGELSTPEQRVESYFILLDFDGIQESERRELLKVLPTSFALTDEQVDELITVGGELLRNHPEFQRLMADVAADARLSR